MKSFDKAKNLVGDGMWCKILNQLVKNLALETLTYLKIRYCQNVTNAKISYFIYGGNRPRENFVPIFLFFTFYNCSF